MARIAFEAPLPPSRLCPGLSPDLEAVILRCLEKKPTDRYGSALELAEDLHRVRNGFPSRARRVGLWGRARLWSRRQPAIAGLLVAVLLALVGGLASVGWQWRRAEAALRSASTAREDADRARVEAERAWAEEGATRVEVEKQREKLGALLGETQSLLSRSQVRLVEGHLARRQFALAQDDLIACPEPARDWEWRYLHRLCRVRLAELPAQPARAVAISPDGKRLATAGADVRLYEASTGKLLRTFEGHDTVAFLLEGLLVAVAPGGLRLLSADGASRRIEVPLDAGEIRHLAVCPKGRHLAAATSRRVLLYPLRDGKPGKPRDVVLSGTGGGLRGLAFSPDGKQLAIASGFQTRLWDVERREPVLLPTAKASSRRPVRMQARAVGVAWSSDGKWVVTAGADGILRGFSPTSGEEAFRLEGHTSAVQALASNGTNPPRLASVGQDGTARVWDLSARKEVAHLPGLRAVALNRAGDRLLASQRDGRVVLWATRPPDPPAAQPWHEQAVAALAFAPGQRLLASGGQGREVLLHRAGALREQAGTVKTEQNTLALAFGPAGRWLAIAQGQKADARTPAGLVAMRDMRTGRETLLRKHSSPVVAVAFDPGGDRLATGGSDGAVVLWRSEGWEAERTLRVKSGRVTGVAFGPRGELVAACTDKGEVHLWQAGSGALVRTMRSEGMQDEDASPGLSGIAFRPDGKQLACAARDSSVALFDLATGKAGFPLVGHTGAAHAVAYSPDGRRLATGGADGTVRLWDPERGDEVLTLRDHKQEVLAVAFSSDGRYLASGGKDNAVIVRDAPP